MFSPRQGEPADEVRLRGERGLVAKLQVELEKTAATLRDRVILGVAIPAAQHKAMIGRGGQHLTVSHRALIVSDWLIPRVFRRICKGVPELRCSSLARGHTIKSGSQKTS